MSQPNNGIAGRALLLQIRSGRPLSCDQVRLLLPAPPDALAFDQLGLDNRTSNALEMAGFRQFPGGLGEVTVGEALRIRGFGVKCLEVYLTASQSWDVPTRHQGVPSPTCERLLTMISNAKANHISVLAPCNLPPLPPGVTVADLDLSVRTRNCISRIGIGTRRRLHHCTVGELMESRAFGRLSLINLLEAIGHAHETALTRGKPTVSPNQLQIEWTPDTTSTLADGIELLLRSYVIRSDDRRFGRFLIDLRCNTTNELIEALRQSRIRSHTRLQLVEHLLESINAASSLTLEQEAAQVREIEPASRRDGMLRSYFGFGERVAVTLREVASEYGLTRERVRQICAPTWLRKTEPYQPILAGVLALIGNKVPARCRDIETELVSAGVAEVDTEVGEILRLATASGLGQDLLELEVESDRLVIHQSNKREIQDARSRARRLIERHGATTAKRVHDDATRAGREPLPPDLIQQVLMLDSRFASVQRDPTWFIFPKSAGGSIGRKVLSVLSIAKSLSVWELRKALRREYRDGLFIPPSAVLAQILPKIEHVQFSGDSVELGCELDYHEILGSSDLISIIDLLCKEGGLCERRKLQSLAIASSVSESNFWRCVNYSPLVARPCRGFYCLVGSAPPPGVIEELQTSNKLVRGGKIDRGWTTDGRLWIAYRLSESMLETGIVGVPAAIRSTLSNEYTVVSGDVDTGGAPIRVGEMNAWGFRHHIADAGGEAGDCMILLFDLPVRTCEVRVGDDTMIDDLIPDES